MCEKNDTFLWSTSCFESEICSGPSLEKEALVGTRKLCSEGKKYLENEFLEFHFNSFLFMNVTLCSVKLSMLH